MVARRVTVAPNPDHPAKFSEPVLEQLRAFVASEGARLKRNPKLLDPMAGVGRIHLLDDVADTVGVEIEPEWAACHPRTEVGDCLGMRFVDGAYDIVATSCTYGNRMADHHTANETCSKCGGSGRRGGGNCRACEGKGARTYKRYSYKFSLGRDPHPASSSTMQWGEPYREFHRKAWREVQRVLTPNGLFLLNISDHVRGHKLQRVAEWHVEHLLHSGWFMLGVWPIGTRRNGNGANRTARAECEFIAALRPPIGGIEA